MVRVGILAITLGLVACETTPRRMGVQRVEVPVPVLPAIPAELAERYAPAALPAFVDLSDPKASSALTPDGEKALRILIQELLARDRAWRAWAQPEKSGETK